MIKVNVNKMSYRIVLGGKMIDENEERIFLEKKCEELKGRINFPVYLDLSDSDYKTLNLFHDTEKEKEVILDAKLRFKLSPPYKGVELEKILCCEQIDEWRVKLNSGTIIAIKEETFNLNVKKQVNQRIAELKKELTELNNHIARIKKGFDSSEIEKLRAVTANLAETRRCFTDSLPQHSRLSDRIKQTSFVQPVDITGKEDNSNPPPRQLTTVNVPSQQFGNVHPVQLINGTNSRTFNNSLLFNEIIHLEEERYQVKNEIDRLKNAGQFDEATITYTFKKGQIVPDDYKDVLECFSYNRQGNCNVCSHHSSCQSLRCHQPYFVIYDINKLQLSEKVRLAAEHMKINFDVPLGDEFPKQMLPRFDEISEEGIIFNSTNGEEIYRVIAEDDLDFKIMYPVVVTGSANNLRKSGSNFIDLFNIDQIYKQRRSDIFFTDSLQLAQHLMTKLPSVLWRQNFTSQILERIESDDLSLEWDKIDDYINHFCWNRAKDAVVTSYYGGQFGKVELDTFPLRSRNVHYLIAEHSGLTMDECIQQVIYNFEQLKSVAGIKLDFYLMKYNKSDYRYELILDKILSASEFENLYLDHDSADAENEKNKYEEKAKDEKSDFNKNKFLLAPFVAHRSFTLLAGEKHTGKTLLSSSIAMSVASGNPLTKLLRPEGKTRKKVLYLNLEIPKANFENKIMPILKSISSERMSDLPLFFEHLPGVGMNIHTEEGVKQLKKIVEQHEENLELLIVDNITAASGHGGGDNVGWTKYTYPFIMELINNGVSVIVVGHLEKGEVIGAKGKLRNAQEVIYLERAGKCGEEGAEKLVRLNVSKKYSQGLFPYFTNKMQLTLDQNPKVPKWFVDDAYLAEIFKFNEKAETLASWFNVSAKTIREWKRNLSSPRER